MGKGGTRGVNIKIGVLIGCMGEKRGGTDGRNIGVLGDSRRKCWGGWGTVEGNVEVEGRRLQ